MKIYVRIWALLLVMLALTVAASYVHFGRFNAVLAIGIASAKAVLIAAYFMHLRSSAKLNWVVAGAAIVWLAILFTLGAGDYLTRGYLPKPAVWQR